MKVEGMRGIVLYILKRRNIFTVYLYGCWFSRSLAGGLGTRVQRNVFLAQLTKELTRLINELGTRLKLLSGIIQNEV